MEVSRHFTCEAFRGENQAKLFHVFSEGLVRCGHENLNTFYEMGHEFLYSILLLLIQNYRNISKQIKPCTFKDKEYSALFLENWHKKKKKIKQSSKYNHKLFDKCLKGELEFMQQFIFFTASKQHVGVSGCQLNVIIKEKKKTNEVAGRTPKTVRLFSGITCTNRLR